MILRGEELPTGISNKMSRYLEKPAFLLLLEKAQRHKVAKAQSSGLRKSVFFSVPVCFCACLQR